MKFTVLFTGRCLLPGEPLVSGSFTVLYAFRHSTKRSLTFVTGVYDTKMS